MYAFRDGKSRVPLRVLTSRLARAVSDLPAAAAGLECLEALLRAGELEAGIVDAPSVTPESLSCSVALTDRLACSFDSADHPPAQSELLKLLEQIISPDSVVISAPEGFAYYGLHPRSYARAAVQLAARNPGVPFAVLGIRSIGTTLSAVARAALVRKGIAAERTTVRPLGYPFDRKTSFSAEQQQWIRRHFAQQAIFLVVDEGPGLSGSSFLSVAEALVECGVAPASVILLCAHAPDAQKLCATHAAERCSRFTWIAVEPAAGQPSDAAAFIGAGLWRKHFYARHDHWPASWTQMERPKFLSADGTSIYKFEGLGHYGRRVLKRAELLHQHGFAPRIEDPGDHTGYFRYALLGGSAAQSKDVSPAILTRLAEYCAMRQRNFAADSTPAASEVTLAAMARANAREEFGIDLQIFDEDLATSHPVICDARMMPWEWILSADGLLYKTDAAGHGDDHFFPGPCDIAWDLAGVIMEWQLSSSAADLFLEEYFRLTGDNPAPRLPAYRLAYSLFRLGYFATASSTMAGTEEEPRLRQARAFYRAAAEQQLAQPVAA